MAKQRLYKGKKPMTPAQLKKYHNQKSKEWREANREKVNSYHRKFYKKNKAKHIALVKSNEKYNKYPVDKELKLERCTQWYKDHRAEVLARNKKTREKKKKVALKFFLDLFNIKLHQIKIK